jgi:hypothetical protein
MKIEKQNEGMKHTTGDFRNSCADIPESFSPDAFPDRQSHLRHQTIKNSNFSFSFQYSFLIVKNACIFLFIFCRTLRNFMLQLTARDVLSVVKRVCRATNYKYGIKQEKKKKKKRKKEEKKEKKKRKKREKKREKKRTK